MEGTPFGRYRLIELLGRGGMGEVWRAHDTDTDRIVAIKLLPAHFSDNEEFQRRFRREAHAASRLNTPHVVPIHNYGEIDGRLYVDMRLIEGRDLESVLAEGPLEPGRAVRIIEGVALALHAAHKIGLVHRDVKPSNILLDEDDFAYLIDFGIARAADETRLTVTGGVIGSWHYMAPERFKANEADARADVYALTCVLYECLTGHTPYPGESHEQQYAGHVATPLPRPSSTNPSVPAGFDRVAEKGLAKDPDQRYATTVELANAARDAITTPLAPPSEPTLLGDVPPATPTPAPTLLADPTLAATLPPQQRRKPAKTRQVIERDKLGVLSKIGQGGQGVVYRAPNVKTKFAASMVYKEYKPQARTDVDFTALAAMPALVEESLSYSQAERLISIAAWPCRIVEDGGAPTGFVMPAIPDEFFIPLTTAKGVSPSTAEFQHLLNHPSVLAARGITVDDAQRFTLLRETASALVFLHKHRVCVGDISPKNLLFSLIPHEGVYFIDCDAMRINTVSALPQVETPGWNAPAGEELATIYTDTYKLALLALRLLSGDHDTTNPQHLPATPTQLRQIITDTLTNQPHQRPLPEAWTSVLGHAIEQAQHQKKTPIPVSAPPDPPPIPIVRSRPPVGPSAPPPSAPPSAPPAWAPPPSTPTSSKTPAWAGAAAAALIVAVLVVGAVGLAKHNNSAPSSTPQTSSTIAQPSTTSSITATPTSTTTSPPAAAGVPGLAPFVGRWTAHEETLVIRQTGSGHLAYADLRACPSCAFANAPTGTLDFTLTSVSNDVATGSVDASSDEQNVVVGAPVTVQLVAGSPSGQILQMSTGRMQQLAFCNDTSAGQCGA
ncbi:protein kinase domain-containing protein [Mycobacterium sp.]|uniref:protein kinase domain-containing protein n=1 Tax=Mycobacterium sp. TaxID=1785 RepID=UPI003BB79777